MYETSLSDYSKEQYGYVKEARHCLLDYCETIKTEHLIFENPGFGHGGSIRNVLVHVADCYQVWINHRILKKPFQSFQFKDYNNIEKIENLFSLVDEFMEQYFDLLNNNGNTNIEFVKDGLKQSVTPFKLFSHVITHEFHHKGQILSMSRQLGYTPADTDIMQ